ncbi:TPA: ribonuclease P protein component [Candidatus Dependentiae bacterium]|nr:ribonuclease P protein component [Candidatus Dependentiae bacterium]HBZ73137.1 ribonuclease P protein component [Candidatus Dependentiae bacterium]
MSSLKFNQLFSFHKKEISQAFELIRESFYTPGLKLLISDNLQNIPGGKILVIISGKVGNAVERNLLRRQIRSIYYEEKLYLKPKVSIIILNSQAKKLTFDEIKKFLVEHLK